MNFKMTVSAAAALAFCALARAATPSYAVVPMPAVDQVHTSALAIDAAGKVLTSNNGAFDETIQYGALCSSTACNRNSPPKRVSYWLGMGPGHGFAGQALYEDGTQYWATYRPAGGGKVQRITTGAAWAINATNQVVGQTGYRDPFTFKDGALTILATLGGERGAAYALNDHGLVVGESQDATGQMRATAWLDGAPTELGVHPSGGTTSTAMAVNEHGTVVGCANKDLSNFRYVTRFEGGEAKIIGAGRLGTGLTNSACAVGINNQGVVVGWSQVAPAPDTHAFVTEGDVLVDLNDRISAEDRAKYTLLTASGINKKGQISVTALRRADYYIVALRLDPQQ